ncbi:unnamed protein product [Lepeophtheirus salmonis]|uniref:(salmon louse) hypothetical protein n=1 Tax=Lepeophtheirus salmonis TaxID=72036 RepID=A0A7R8CS37_LEPSM|nr:unnamed protein product [Lepeophtheirus salmonis]CAF2861236.1 unnamed protein product [Lepeophtheirus salmonis]
MSQVLRYVKITDNEVKVEQSFLRFIEMKGKNAEQITSMILKQLEMDDINIQDCRGQAFDNVAVMAGHRSGVQTRIREVNPNIVFVPCNNHSLNLEAVHAALVPQLIKWNILIEITGVTIKRTCETRWSSRSDAVKVIHTKFTEVITTLERLMEDVENATTRSDAGLILQAMLSFSFLTFLSLWRGILREINDTQKFLQTKGLDLQQCAFKLSALNVSLLQNRDKIVEDTLAYSTQICSDMGISTERRIRKKKILNAKKWTMLLKVMPLN